MFNNNTLFTVVVEFESFRFHLGVVRKQVEIIYADDEGSAREIVRSMYGDDQEDPGQVHRIEVHETTEAEKLLKSELDRLYQQIWDLPL